MRVTVRHYYDFGIDQPIVGSDLVNPESWDRLRTATSGAFSMPTTREAFVRAAEQQPEIAARARAIDAWLEARRAHVVASYGVGGGVLEWWLHRLRPDRKLIVTDYGQATLARLGELFPEAEVRYHDLRRDSPLPADVHLFHRVDTELSNSEWLDLLRRFSSASILIVAAEVLNMRGLLRELLFRPVMKARTASRAGFVRTSAVYETLWRPTHLAEPIRLHDHDAWALTPRPVDTSRRSDDGEAR